ncbi:unnamed protein product, partial [Mesorhabditis belari]|uniref:Uncharacterized protein n=1 Tax=Mesorhabditis belari TaxID=2138241 RepID=A0AAF3EAU6_9BILA
MLVICCSDLIDLMDDRDVEYWPDLGADLGTSSMYEDALDERIDSDSELRKLCVETKKVLSSRARDRERTKPLQPQLQLPASPPIPTYSKQASSSSEHSSIEKIQPSTIRRNYHGSRARKSKSATSSREDSGEARHPMQYMYPSVEWQLYPVLLQLSQTLQAMSSQLHEMDTANRLQLRIVYQILRMILDFKRESSQGWLPRWVWPSLRWMTFIFLWPLLARLLWIWYSKRRFLIAKTLTKYL